MASLSHIMTIMQIDTCTHTQPPAWGRLFTQLVTVAYLRLPAPAVLLQKPWPTAKLRFSSVIVISTIINRTGTSQPAFVSETNICSTSEGLKQTGALGDTVKSPDQVVAPCHLQEQVGVTARGTISK